MLLAEAPTIVVGLDAALTIAGGIAGGLAAGAKVLVWFFQKILDKVVEEVKDNRDEIKESRDEQRLMTESLIALQRDSIQAKVSFQACMEKLVDRIDRASHKNQAVPNPG